MNANQDSDRGEPQLRRILFRDQAKGEHGMVQFWRMAQPLARVISALPTVANTLTAKVNVKVPLANVKSLDALSIMNSAKEFDSEIAFPCLPEPLFERLALRFRPFYVKGDSTNFRKTLNSLAAENVELRAWATEFKQKWKRAIFWGAMGMPHLDPPADAEEVIRAAFYSRYFHTDSDQIAYAARFETALGKDMFRVALVSSVWQRSLLVQTVAEEFEGYLLRMEILEDCEVAAAKTSQDLRETISLRIAGGVGGLSVKPFDPANPFPTD